MAKDQKKKNEVFGRIKDECLTFILIIRTQTNTVTLEDLWQFLIKLNILLPHNAAVMLLGIYATYVKTYVHQKACRLQM